MSTDQAAEAAHVLATGLAAIGQATAPIMEAVEGYRAQLDAAGWGDGIARKMAADYHAALLRVCFK